MPNFVGARVEFTINREVEERFNRIGGGTDVHTTVVVTTCIGEYQKLLLVAT